MASVSISEKEYQALARVICDLHDRGEIEDAEILDKFAKKANTAFSRQRYGYSGGGFEESEASAQFQAPSPLETHKKISAKLAGLQKTP